jgi:hypothetical protein
MLMVTHRLIRILAGCAVLLAVVVPALAQEVVVTGPPPALRANLDAFVKALNTGTSAEWEAMAQKVFTADFYKKQTAAERKKTLESLRAAYGKVSVERVDRQGGPDAPLQVRLKGTVGSGVLWIALDDDSRFDSVKSEVTVKGDKEPRADNR